MAEVFTWAEGSAYFWSGNSSTSARLSFARNATVATTVSRYRYRVPYASTWTYIEIDRGADLSISQGFSDKSLLNYHQNAAGGVVHCHIKNVVGTTGTSGGIFLWTGEIKSLSVGGGDGSEMAVSLAAHFDNWSAY
jgi:hypothetical protein